jgi:hypothetical protein
MPAGLQLQETLQRALKPSNTNQLRLGEEPQNRTPPPQLVGSLRGSTEYELIPPGGLDPARSTSWRCLSCSAMRMHRTSFFVSCSEIKSNIIVALLLGAAHSILPRELSLPKRCHVSIQPARPQPNLYSSCLSNTNDKLESS